MTIVDDETSSAPPAATEPRRRSRAALASAVVIAVAALVAVLAGGYLWGNRTAPSAAAGPSAVDIGFAQDMGTHHRQAITMAETEQAQGSSEQAKLYAFDIDSAQSVQLGQLQGWLASWGQNTASAHPMAWMGAHMADMAAMSDGLMPGMATPAQMTALKAAHGKAEDVLFLQLMINHHLGGVHMAEYAAAHATEPYVRVLAQRMVDLQSGEIVQMEGTLRQLGGTPLAPPAE